MQSGKEIRLHRRDLVLLGVARRDMLLGLTGENLSNPESLVRKSFANLLREGLLCNRHNEVADHPEMLKLHQTELGEAVSQGFTIAAQEALALHGSMPHFVRFTISAAEREADVHHEVGIYEVDMSH